MREQYFHLVSRPYRKPEGDKGRIFVARIIANILGLRALLAVGSWDYSFLTSFPLQTKYGEFGIFLFEKTNSQTSLR
jgi:hypothetical protein